MPGNGSNIIKRTASGGWKGVSSQCLWRATGHSSVLLKLSECLALPAFWTGTNKHGLLDFNRKALVPLSNYLEAEGVIQRR